MFSLTAAAPPEPCCHNQQISDGICAAAGETHDTVIHTAFFFLSTKRTQYWQNLPTSRILDHAKLVCTNRIERN